VTSSIALGGIVTIYLASRWGLTMLYSLTDILATCLVLAIVVKMIIGIMVKSVGVLLDRTLPAQTELLKEIVSKIPNVVGVENVRTRESGKHVFVDLTLDVDRNLTVESSEAIRRSAERTIRERIGADDVLLQVKPVATETEGIVERIRSIGIQEGYNLHHITVHSIDGRLHVDLDLEVEGEMKLADAHALSDLIESKIKRDNPSIGEVNTHIDWRKELSPDGTIKVKSNLDRTLIERIGQIVREKQGIISCNRISVEEEGPGEIVLTVHCTMRPEEKAERVQKVVDELEKTLMERVEHSKRVIIHVEPEEKTG
jgi:divalent metal cation (Fe/Co/Zn/Cd) transporter